MTLSISNGKILSTLQILTIQIKYNDKSTINYLKEEDFTTLFFLTQNDSYDTFESKDDSSIKLLFAKEDCKWWKIHKKHSQFSSNGGWIMQRKRVSTVIYWS